MDASRRKKVVLRWTLFISALVAAYRLWRWYALGALVPVTVWREAADASPRDLGFAVSPLWDILVAAACTAFIALVLTSPRMNDNGDPDEETALQKAGFLLLVIPMCGPALGLLFSFLNGLTVGVAMGLVFTAAVVAILLALFALIMPIIWLVKSAPLKALGRWLMAR